MSRIARAVLWFRRDLRLHDLPALAAACDAAEEVVPLFVFDDALLTGRWPSPNRVAFLLESLRALDESLRARGSRLHFRRGRPVTVVPAFAAESGASAVFISRDYAPYGRRRDRAVARALGAVPLQEFPGVLVHEPEDVCKPDGTPYTVYTPFRRQWEALPRRAVLPPPGQLRTPRDLDPGTLPSCADLGIAPPTASILPGGEPAARARLERFLAVGLAGYAANRNDLGRPATSRLSQDLRWGLLSPLEVAERGAASPTFVSEVIWREFFASILFHFPTVRREAFQPRFRTIRWRNDPDAIAAWKAGRTGFPVVDAGMRELEATGFLHNRARMIVASFLTKQLLVDWRIGEAHFMAHLVDGDLASNNGGWQWTAGVGTDAAPYFRVFNPILQGERFDPEGLYVRRWVPELRNVPTRFIHQPWRMPAALQAEVGCRIGVDYPAPIVDLDESRQRAIEAYRAASA
ncbi:MAG: deoxyribodipyrimidine photo-lyase [Chloroflexota bacterium]|nr:DNA photolyase family protein [Dehalococcoidia bacterium]MDW8252680.1 deoxyribodipyrimidine photo-lyase [Chloroflexota bacterium]